MLRSIDAFIQTRSTSCSNDSRVSSFAQPFLQERHGASTPHQETPLNLSPFSNLEPNNDSTHPESHVFGASEEPVEDDEQNGHMEHRSGIEASSEAAGMDVFANAAAQAASWQNVCLGTQRGQLHGFEPTRPDVNQ
jgi:hypothetical protein